MTDQAFNTVIKGQLKAARERRGKQPDGLADLLKQHAKAQRALMGALADGSAKTVPELAQETGLDSQELLWHVTALRKYNKLADGPKRGEYISYQKKD